MLDLISIGDTTLDVFLKIKDARVYCDINTKACQLSLNFADKIPIKEVINVPAVGTAPNVAMGTSHLGMKVGLYTILGNDQVGKEMYDVLEQAGFDMEYVVMDKEKPSDYSVVLVFEGERTILVYHEERNYVVPDFNHTHWLFLGAIGQDPTVVHDAVAKHAEKSLAKLAFNPGPVQIEQGRDALEPLLKHTHLIFLNKEEARRLSEHTSTELPELLKAIYDCGPEIVVITDGKNGSYCYDGTDMFHYPAYAEDVVEATGCGDAYASGFIAGLHNDRGIAEAMAWGAFNASSVLKYVGAQKGLLKKDTIKEMIQEHSHLQAKKI